MSTQTALLVLFTQRSIWFVSQLKLHRKWNALQYAVKVASLLLPQYEATEDWRKLHQKEL